MALHVEHFAGADGGDRSIEVYCECMWAGKQERKLRVEAEVALLRTHNVSARPVNGYAKDAMQEEAKLREKYARLDKQHSELEVGYHSCCW